MDACVDLPNPEADEDPVRAQAERLNDAAMHIVKVEPRQGLPAAISMLRRAVALDPEIHEVWSNLGLVLWRSGRVEEASKAFEQALLVHPESPEYQANAGIFAGAIGQSDKARKHLQEAIRLDPDTLSHQWDLCLLDLRDGRWDPGLANYDIRRQHHPAIYPRLPAPLWRGEDLDGKVIYVQCEQGFGDRFLFCRYFAWIKERWPGCKLKVCLNDALVNVFWEYRHVIDEFLPEGVPWPSDIDYASYLCTLPEIHGSRPDFVPPDPGFLRQRIAIQQLVTTLNLPAPNLPSLKVGLCWTGSSAQARNHDRSIPLEMLLPLVEDPNITLYSFQCSPGKDDITRLSAHNLIYDCGSQIEKEGWVGTGMALCGVDLLLTVCTSVAHLAGALGIPTWTLLCADPYWPWLRYGTSTPWYKNMRLFRQRKLGDWQPVVDNVRIELSALAAQHVS